MKIIRLAGHVEMKTFDVEGKVREDWEYLGTYMFFPFLGVCSDYILVNKILTDFLVRVECAFPNAECGYLLDCVRSGYHLHIFFRGVRGKDLLEDGRLRWNWGYYAICNSKGQVMNYPKRS